MTESSGRVVAINISAGGVPKLPVASAALTADGLVGDGHDDLKHHGGKSRAVCIYALEIINALRDEGHPISPGTAGENLTIAGLDWKLMVPGARVRIGATAVELTGFTSPCRTIRRSFVNGCFARISQITNPGWSRVYAKVLGEGTIKVGDSVEIVAG